MEHLVLPYESKVVEQEEHGGLSDPASSLMRLSFMQLGRMILRLWFKTISLREK